MLKQKSREPFYRLSALFINLFLLCVRCGVGGENLLCARRKSREGLELARNDELRRLAVRSLCECFKALYRQITVLRGGFVYQGDSLRLSLLNGDDSLRLTLCLANLRFLDSLCVKNGGLLVALCGEDLALFLTLCNEDLAARFSPSARRIASRR